MTRIPPQISPESTPATSTEFNPIKTSAPTAEDYECVADGPGKLKCGLKSEFIKEGLTQSLPSHVMGVSIPKPAVGEVPINTVPQETPLNSLPNVRDLDPAILSGIIKP